MNDEVRIPDIEVIVGAAGNDCAVFAFYRRDDIHDGYEVVCALDSARSRTALRQILQDCITTLNAEDWRTVDELGQGAAEGLDAPPF